MRLLTMFIYLPNLQALWFWQRKSYYESSDQLQIDIFTNLQRDRSFEDDVCIARRGLDEAAMVRSWKQFMDRLSALVEQEKAERMNLVNKQPPGKRSLAEAYLLNPEQSEFIKNLSRLPKELRPIAAKQIIKSCDFRSSRPLDRSRKGSANLTREIFGRLTFDHALRQHVCDSLGNKSYKALRDNTDHFIQLLRGGLLFFDPYDANSLTMASMAISNFCITWGSPDLP